MLFTGAIGGLIGINDIMGRSSYGVGCHNRSSSLWCDLSGAASLVEPFVKRFFVDAQTPLTKPDDFEIACIFAEIIRFANTHTKDISYLLSGIGTLNSAAASRFIHNRTPFAIRQLHRYVNASSLNLFSRVGTLYSIPDELPRKI